MKTPICPKCSGKSSLNGSLWYRAIRFARGKKALYKCTACGTLFKQSSPKSLLHKILNKPIKIKSKPFARVLAVFFLFTISLLFYSNIIVFMKHSVIEVYKLIYGEGREHKQKLYDHWRWQYTSKDATKTDYRRHD